MKFVISALHQGLEIVKLSLIPAFKTVIAWIGACIGDRNVANPLLVPGAAQLAIALLHNRLRL